MDTPYSLVRLEETGSTQDVARATMTGTPVLVVADRQTAGRGRSGSVWLTAPRAVAGSLAFPDGRYPLTLVPLVAGVAMAESAGLSLKWPNDLVGPDGKVGGILCETSGGTVVVGVGLNLWWPEPPPGVAGLLPSDPGPGAGDELMARWATRLLLLLANPAWPAEHYRRLCLTLGQEIVWEPGGRGRAIDISDDGGLVVAVEGEEVVLRSGAVRHVR